MSIQRNRPPKGQEVWITKSNLLSLLPRETAERIIRNAVTNSLGGNIPRLIPSKSTWDNASNSAWHTASKWIQDKAEAYSELYGLGDLFGRAIDIRILLNGGRGEATCIQSEWGKVLCQHYKLPIKWRFKNDSLAYVPALFAELNKLAGELPSRYEKENEYYAGKRRKNRATTFALRKQLGFQKDEERINDIYSKGSTYALDRCLRTEWSSSRHHKKAKNIEVDLTVSGNHANRIDCDLRLNFSIHDEELRKKNHWRLAQLFKAVRELTGNQETEVKHEAIPAT